MTFLSLYRKYRPLKFNDLVGQDYVITTLRNALKNNRIAHAYLFAGPRGTGKTSTAKVLAAALNCEDDSEIEPCGKCSNCQKIQSGQSMDVIEIDAASNRGIDEIRELREKVKFYPGEGPYKVYIIDEVHMLTTGAFNALLKTLEEPPENVVFILATTEPHQVINTILSRCQRFDFSLLSVKDIQKRLSYICSEEVVEYEGAALNMIAHSSNGGMRDAISILDQAISYTENELTADTLVNMLGKVNKEVLQEFIDNISNNKSAAALELVNELVEKGKGVSRFVSDLIEHCRHLLLIKECGINSGLIEYSKDRLQLMETESQSINTDKLMETIAVLTDVDKELKFSNQPRLLLEMAVVKLTAADTDIDNLQNRLSDLEYKLQELQHTLTSGASAQIKKQQNINTGPETKEYNTDKIVETEQDKEREQEESPAAKEEMAKVKNDQSQRVEKKSQTSQDGPLNIDRIRKMWPTILGQLKAENISTHAFLVEGKPVQVKEDIVYIEFSRKKRFHKKGAEREYKLIKKIFNNVLSQSCDVMFLVEGEKISNNAVEADNEEKEGRGEEKSLDLIKKVAKMFDGEVIKADQSVLDNK